MKKKTKKTIIVVTIVVIVILVIYILIGMLLSHCINITINPIHKVLLWPISLLNGRMDCSIGV